jgi:hypothetical protein
MTDENKIMTAAELERDVFEQKKKRYPEHGPYYEPMADIMGVDILVNKECKVWVTHDERLPGIPQWAEFDVDDSSLAFICKGGKVQDVGMKIQPTLRRYLRGAKNVEIMFVQEKKLVDMWRVPLIIREVGEQLKNKTK